VHKHENFKPLKGNGRGRIRKGKERGTPGYFVLGPRVPRYATAVSMTISINQSINQGCEILLEA